MIDIVILYIVLIFIGNLDDISVRVICVLSEVSWIVVEDICYSV